MSHEQSPVPGQLLGLGPTGGLPRSAVNGTPVRVGFVYAVVHHENGKEIDGFGAHWTVSLLLSGGGEHRTAELDVYPQDVFERLAEP